MLFIQTDPISDIPCFIFNNKYNLFICNKCDCALSSQQCSNHFKQQHQLDYNQSALNQFIKRAKASDLLKLQNTLAKSIDPVDQVHGLLVHDALKCDECNKISTSQKVMQACLKSHKQSVAKCSVQKLSKVPMYQTLFEICIDDDSADIYEQDDDDEKQQEQIEIDNEAKRLINDAFNFSHDGIVYERAKALGSLGNLDVKSRSIVYSTWGFHDVSELMNERIDDILAAIKPSRKKTPAQRILQVMCYSYFAHGDALLKSSQLHLKQRLYAIDE